MSKFLKGLSVVLLISFVARGIMTINISSILYGLAVFGILYAFGIVIDHLRAIREDISFIASDIREELDRQESIRETEAHRKEEHEKMNS